MASMDEGDSVSAPSASVRQPGRGGEASWYGVSLSPLAARVPPSCACCGAAATRSLAARRASDGAELLVGYCTECMAHAGRDGTRTLAVALASLLLATTVGVAWPLLALTSSLAAHLAVVVCAGLLPLAFAALVRPSAPAGHAAWGRAVAWSGQKLVCARHDYATALIESNPGARFVGERLAPWFSAWMTAGPVLGLIGSTFVHGLYYPSLRVLNLSGERFELLLDGKRVGHVEASSVESPAAGRELSLTAGKHRLQARSESGTVLSNVEVTLKSGKAHLYAPGSAEYCFWLERQSYGRARLEIERTRLVADDYFWTLPADLDGWFTPPPDPGAGEQALSGGVVTTLRQARCAQAPLSEQD
ncbi:MAG TPA: hypothetical protein VM686_18815 [Polyangiaceae bacterium]|nr:hypothetical protein [Polyangiaceae bacterium]